MLTYHCYSLIFVVMKEESLTNSILDQSKNPIWMVNLELQLVYANRAYFNRVKEVTGVERKLNESVFVEGYGDGYNETWRVYYNRALAGEYFEIEEHSFHPLSNDIQYSQTTFEPLADDERKIIAVACQSKDVTGLVRHKTEANQMLDSSLDVFCTVNEQDKFVYVSAASTHRWGYTPEELIGTSNRDLVMEDDVPKTNDMVAAIVSGQEVTSFVNRYKKKNGEIAYNLWSTRWDDTTKLRYAVASDCGEKSDQKEIDIQSEQRFKAMVQEGSDLIGILDAAGNYLYVSPTSISVLGIAPEEFVGRNAFEFIHPDDVERTLASLQHLSIENRVIVEPFRFQNNKNEWRWMETILTNMLDNPAVKGIVANSRDITDRNEEKHRLKLLESVIINTKDAIIITEAEPFDEPGNRIIFVNDAFTKMTGYEAEEVIGKSPRILQGPNSSKEGLAKLGQSLRRWEPCELTTINYKKSGEEFWINFALTPVANEKGWYTHWISIERDVTEQKIKEMKNELLAQISTNYSAENDYTTAAYELCKSVSLFGRFEWVEIWVSNLEKSQMHLLSHYVADPSDEEFYGNSPETDTFKIVEGLAGKVWSEGAQLLWMDLEKHEDFLRKDAAKRIGLKAVLGIPLIFSGEVVGVLQIGTKKDATYLQSYTHIFKQLEGLIGSELSRKKLENDMKHLFDAIPDILCLTDFQGKFLKMNRAGCELLGYSEADILYHSFAEFVHPEDKDISTDEMLRLRHGETTFEFENRYITKGGDIVWLNWFCNSAMEEGLIYATAKNITEEKKLRELNRQSRKLAKFGSWEVDVVNEKVSWSEEVHQLHETDPTTFVPRLETSLNYYREDYRESTSFSFERCISTGEPFDFEAVLVTAQKKELWVRVIGNAEFVDGTCKRIYGSFQNIHARKEAELRLLSLADNLPGVVFQYLINTDGTDSLKYVSKNSEQVWGFAADDVIHDNQLVWDSIVAGGEIENVRKSISNSVESRTKWAARWKYVMPSGEIKTHMGYGSPNYLADGTVLFHSVVLDVTQEAKNEELVHQYTHELERSNAELEQFAFVASHDLQEPLRMISSFMDLLQRKYGDQLDEKALQYIHFATDGAKRMKQIILDLLDYSRSSRPTEGMEEVDMDELLSDYEQLRRKSISEKAAMITSNDLPTINTYRAALTQILHCLLDNAIKYSRQGTTPIVDIHALDNEQEWEISIKDNGIGIEPQFFDKIFVIFQRLHNKEQYSGTGIGLSIAQRHVELLGGRIWLESIPGAGTTFYFTIPKD